MFEHVPQALKNLSQWVCWQFVPDEARPDKPKKMPINPHTGGQAQSNNPETWATFSVALRESAKYDGIGFMFANGYFGVDIDNIDGAIEDYRNGETENIVGEFIHTLQSYAEYSVSGKGIHIICKGSLPATGRRKKNVEMYESGRFFIVTGNLAAEYAEVTDCTQRIKQLHEKYIGGGTAPTTGIKPASLNLSDSEVIDRARQSEQGGKFLDLYQGNWRPYFQSQSEADMSFAMLLAFWCQRDESQMDRIFRSSGLYREKWDQRHGAATYGQSTIAKAAKSVNQTYQPKPEYNIVIGNQVRKKPERKRYSFDDTGNAERLYDQFGESIGYSYIDKGWYFYDGRRWQLDFTGATRSMVDEVVEAMRGEADLYAADEDLSKNFEKHLKRSRSSSAKTAMLTETQHRSPIMPDQLDAHNQILNATNGIINLRTGTLEQHDRSKYLTRITHTEYTDKIDTPLWSQFLKDIFGGDNDLIRYVQKAVGYSLTGSTQEQCAFFLYGTGRNGKSTFLDAISEILGDYAANVQPESLMVKSQSGGANSDIARLKGARFVTSVEPGEGMRLNEGLVKQLTGGDKVTARKLYGCEFEFSPEFKLWMGTNHKPIIRGTDLGIWRRIHLIPFNVQIPDERADKRLKYKLRTEYPGILNWAVEGCLLWQREGLKKPACVEEAVKEYRNEMDVISAFIDACCTIGTGSVAAAELFRVYAEWAESNNEYKMSNTKFGREMANKFEKHKGLNGARYINISLNEESRPYNVSFCKK